MDLHSKMAMYVTSTMTSPVTKTAKTAKWLRQDYDVVIAYTCSVLQMKPIL